MVNIKIEVKNLGQNENLSKHSNHTLLSQGISDLIIGKSGCCKTTLQINLLLRPGWLDYNNINIFGKSLFQQQYDIHKKAFEEKLPKEVIIRFFENQNEVIYLGICPMSIIDWRKRLDTNLMLSAIFINRLKMCPTLENYVQRKRIE